jgi:signal transduction histidine kinase
VGKEKTKREYGRAVSVYQLTVVIPVVVLLTNHFASHWRLLDDPYLLFWGMAIAIVDLMPVPAWGGLHLSLTFPIRLSLAILFPPLVAAVVALLGSFDPRELRGQVGPITSLFNRSQIALSVLAESAVFHLVASAKSPPLVLVAATLLAALVGYTVNTTVVAIAARLATGLKFGKILTRMHGVAPYQFLIEHFGLGLSAAVIVKVYGLGGGGPWAVAAFLAALAFARQMYFQSRGLTDRLAEQNEVLAEQAARLEGLLAKEQEAVAELQELNQMRSDFVAVVSHELRTPLTAIIGFAKTLRRPEFANDDATRVEFLQAMERQGDRLLRLVENLLTVSRLEKDAVTPSVGRVKFADMCREVVEGLGAEAERMRISIPATIPVLYTDRDLLSRVVSNLLDNALKYSPDGTPCELGASVDGDSIMFWVRDYGIGIPAGELSRVFDRFYQVDSSTTRVFRGTGLGLALVKDLLEQLGGHVALESEPGRGSTFTVTLPTRHPKMEGTDEGAPRFEPRYRPSDGPASVAS